MTAPSSCGVLVPLALLLGASLQGCTYNHLTPSVQIAIGHACAEKVDAVSEKEQLKNLGFGCDDLDKDKLEALGMTTCAESLKKATRRAGEVECEDMVADKVTDACENVDADCKKTVESEVGNWELSKIEQEDSDKANVEGFEEVVALIAECHKGVIEKVDKLGVHGPGAKACPESGSANLTIMGVTHEHCKEYRKKEVIDMETFRCTDWCLNQEDTPNPDEVTADDLKTTVSTFLSDHFGQADKKDGAEAADRLRLFETAIRLKMWPQKFQPWSHKIGKIGAAAVVALAASLVIASVQRRTRHAEARDEELLTNIE